MVDSPSGGAPAKAPRWDLADTEGYGGGNISPVAPWMFSGYVGLYRRRSTSVAARGAHEGGGAPTVGGTPGTLVASSLVS